MVHHQQQQHVRQVCHNRPPSKQSNGTMVDTQIQQQLPNSGGEHVRVVSFRDDVVFPLKDDSSSGGGGRGFGDETGPTAATDDSHRSKSSNGSSGDELTMSNRSTTSGSSRYSKLRSNLTREQTNRDPMYFYQVTKHLGEGSMGDVKLVTKKQNQIGGSARRDLRTAIRRQKLETKCIQLPVIGNVFKLCMDGDLKDASQHSTAFSVLTSSTARSTSTPSIHNRSFDDSFMMSSSDNVTGSSSSNKEIIYAMKSILVDKIDNTRQELLKELRNEIDILKGLDHPNIVRAIETFEYKGEISIVMELCSGGDLYIRDPYTEMEAARIVTSILSAVAYMHSRNVVHRDLKYENVLFVNTSPMSDVKLIDFGLSKKYQTDNELTDVCGTIYTMAPEVIKGNHTEKADLWSIGVMTFMLLSSSLPFYGKTQQKVAKMIVGGKFKFGGKRWGPVSEDAKAFIKACLVSDPDKRLTAEQALQTPWISHWSTLSEQSGNGGGMAEEKLVKASLRNYASYPKLRKMALMVVAHQSSSDEIGILRKIFRKYDARGDGSIRLEDFCQAFGHIGSAGGVDEEDWEDVFEAMDLDGTGRIRYTEFIAAAIEAHGPISEARLAEAFDRLDCDDSGAITAENLMEIVGDEVPMDEILAIIEEADLSNNNCVSYSDYLMLWEDQPKIVVQVDKNKKVLESELSNISVETEASSTTDGHSEFLQNKHIQNTLHTWVVEMQLPAQEFAKGCSFLHKAALGKQSDLEAMLNDHPNFVNFRDYDRRTALHVAASEGYLEICTYLVKKGSRINRADRWGGFPLDDAHRHGRLEVIRFLRKHGAKFGSTSKTVNLITACSKGNVQEVETLLEFGSIDLNQGDYDNRTALHLAANEGHLEVVKLLCEAGANVNVKDRWGDLPLDDAKKAKKNSLEIIQVLKGGGDITSTVHDVAIATMDALKDQSTNRTAITSSSNEVEDEDEGMTQLPFQEFALGCSILHQAALGLRIVLDQILLERPELVNFRDYDRRTALHISASEGNLQMCEYLVTKGAKINRVDRWGGSPLDDAYREKHSDVVNFLRKQGGMFGSTSQLSNFITAASEGDVDEVRAFLTFGNLDVDEGDYDKRTALHLAVSNGHVEVVKVLCDAGADVNVEDRWGNRPLDDSSRSKQNAVGVIKVLMKHGAKSKNFPTMLSASLLSVLPG